MQYMTMGATERHMSLLDWFSGFAFNKKKEELYFDYGREQIALVENYDALIDIGALTDVQREKLRESMGKLKYTYPDFMIFKNNPVIKNENRTRYAGIPDLIVEVWSTNNSDEEKEHKRRIYCTDKSEFWEFEQNSPKIICWDREGNKYEQFMDKPLIAPWGEELDLVELSHDVNERLPNDRFHGGPDIGGNIDL